MFTDSIKGIIERREITYKKLEYSTGYDRSFISRVINRKKKIPKDPAFIEKICRAVGLNPEDFPEYRERIAEQAFKSRPDIRERIYREIEKEERLKRKTS